MEIKVKACQPNGTEFEAYNSRQVPHLDDSDNGKQFIDTHAHDVDTTRVSIGDTQTMVLNIGGSQHEVARSTLLRFPKTKLGRLDESSPNFRAHKGDYYFDRSPEMFSSILNYYRTGALHLPNRLCGLAFQEELDFWGIGEGDIASCCWGSFNESHCVKNALEGFEKCFNNAFESEKATDNKRGDVRSQKCASGMRQKVWLVLNDPTSSTAAKVCAIVTTIFIIISILCLCLETHSDFKANISTEGLAWKEFGYGDVTTFLEKYEIDWQINTEENCKIDTINPDTGTTNGSTIQNTISSTISSITSEPLETDSSTPEKILVIVSGNCKETPYMLDIIDIICFIYFSIELIIRLVFSPSKLRFIFNVFTIFDILAVFPYYLVIFQELVNPTSGYKTDIIDIAVALRALRVFQLFRIMRHYTGVQVLYYTFKVSIREFLLLLIMMLLGMLIFACFIYFAENYIHESDSPNKITSIPVGLWWALVTMTTIGYGDFFPTTATGYIIGSMCVLCGVLTVAFTVPIIVNNFMMYYRHASARRNPTQSKTVENIA